MEEDNKIIIEIDEDEFESREEKKKTIRVLSFLLGGEKYCVQITDAKEVFGVSFVTKVPNAPQFVVGVANLHGAIIPIIDIRYFLGLERKEGLGNTKAIVSDVCNSNIGFVVDGVGEAMDIEEDSIQPPLATIKGRLRDFTRGQMQIGEDIIIILELKKILKCEEIESLKKGVS